MPLYEITQDCEDCTSDDSHDCEMCCGSRKTRSYWITDNKTFQLFSPLLESFYPVEYANPKTQLLSEDVNYTGSNWQHSPVYKSEFMESLGAFNYWIQIYNIDLMQGITLKPEGGEDHGYLCGAMLEELIRFRVYESIALFILEEALIKRRYDVEVNDWVMGMSEFGRIWVDITDTLSDKTFTAGWNENWKDQETGDEAQISEDVKAAFDRIQRDAYPEGYWEHEEDWEVGFRG